MKLTVTLPLPPQQLNPNARCTWRARLRPKKAYRQRAADEAWLATLGQREQLAMPWQTATIAIRWFSQQGHRKDRDNVIASLKAAIDGLVDARILSDDKGLEYGSVACVQESKAPRVELIITKTG